MTIEQTSGHEDVETNPYKLERFNDMLRSLCYEPVSDVAIIVGSSLTTVLRSMGDHKDIPL